MTITLTPETEARLRQRAAGEGQDFDRIADTLLQIGLDWEAEAETIEVLQRSLVASDAGRVRPFSQFAEEMRSKYALPTHLSDHQMRTEGVTP